MIRPILAIVLLIAAVVAGAAIAHARGFGWQRTVRDLIAICGIGVLGLALAGYAVAGVAVTTATGVVGSRFIWTWWSIAVASMVVTPLTGLALAEKLWRPLRGRARGMAGALAGLCAGIAISVAAIVLSQNTSLEMAALCLIPPAAASATFTGFALAWPRERRR